MLDNSDFRNPVNQRGQISYSGVGYAIDRWKTWNSGDALTINDGYITITGGQYVQYIKGYGDGFYSAFAKKTDGTIIALDTGYESQNDWRYVALPVGDYIWAALYEGEYTTETLPPYVSDGYAFEMVKSNGGATAISKVWENASPDSSFAAQTVSLDLADAQLVAIVHKGSTTGTVDLITFVEMNKKTQTISYANAGGGSATVTYVRTVDVTPTGVTFAKGVTKQIGSTSVGEDNAKCIPLRIYAIKGV